MIWGKNIKASSNYNFPYFSENVDYNKLPGINQMTYDEIVELFFNKGVFSNMFERIDETDQKYNESNILKMLSLLFPTKNRNLTTSSNIIFQNGAMTPSNNSSFFDIFKQSQLESYLKVNNTVYTVSNVIYVNDIINHPKYRDLMNSIKKYYIAGLDENTKLLSNENENFIKEFKKIDKKQLSDIREKIQDIDNHSNTNTNTDINIRINIKNAKELLNDITAIVDNENENVSVYDSERTNNIINVLSKHLNNIEKLSEDKLFSSITQYFRNINKISKKIKLLDRVKNFYSKGAININDGDDGDEKEMMNIVNRFQPYKNVVGKIKQLIEPNLISRNEKLQQLIVSYSKNMDTDNSMIRLVNKMFILLKNFEMDAKVKENQTLVERKEFSIDEFGEFANINNTVYLEKFVCEVFLNIDLIERDENNKNSSVNGSCKLKSEILGNSIENVMNPKKNNYELSKYRISSKIMGGKKRNRMSKKYKMKGQRSHVLKTRRIK
jgi:hypothetical protein